MRWSPILAAARCTSLLSCTLAVAYSQGISPPPDANARIDKIFAQFNRSDSPGCVAGAAIAGVTVLTAAYGMADLEHNVPLTPQSVLETGSVAKQFTAGAVLLLAQQGKLSLDDSVRKYFPELPEYVTPITLRQLLNHTSGFRDWGNVEAVAGWPRTTRVYTHAYVLDIVSRQRSLNFPPGTEYSYTNTGYNLLAILTERITKKSFQDFTKEAMFAPLGMSSTQWRDDFQRIVPNRAIAYNQTAESIRMLMPFENIYGNGGLLTTVSDLLKWNQNFTDAKLGGRAFTQAQEQQGRLNNGQTIPYAAGLFVGSWKGLREVSHDGGTAGYRAWLARYPDQGLSVALLCNTSAADVGSLGHQVAEVYLGTAVGPDRTETPVASDPAALESDAGVYVSAGDHHVLRFDVKNGRLQINGAVPLTPISPNVFRPEGDVALVAFESNQSGKTFRLRVLVTGEPDQYFEKVEAANLGSGELESMTGEYVSDEAETTFTVTVQEGRLVIRRRPDVSIPLTPTYRDAFSSSLGSVRFIRDARGRVTEMSIGEERVWDLRFRRAR